MATITDIEFNEKHEVLIENAVADGCETNAEIAGRLGIEHVTFEGWKNRGNRKDATEKSRKRSARIAEAIKKGDLRRRENFIKRGESALAKLVSGYSYSESETIIERFRPRKPEDLPKGVTMDDQGFVIKERTKITTKHIQPNMAAVAFALVNMSEGKWKSINKIDPKEFAAAIAQLPATLTKEEREAEVETLLKKMVAKQK